MADFALGTLCAFVLSLPAQPQIAGAHGPAFGPKPPVNQYGAPVATSSGKPVNYDEAQMAMQYEAWLAAGSPGGEAPLAGCESSALQADWKYYAYGSGIGDAGLAVSVAGGHVEIVLGCGAYGFSGNPYWMILERGDSAFVDYVQRFVSPVYSSGGVRRLVVAEVDGDASPEIVVALISGVIEIWDQATRKLQGGFQAMSGITAALVRDVDQDGEPELILATDTNLRVYSMNGVPEWNASVGGKDLAVGQMDADPALEIAITSGRVFDADTHVAQWTSSAGFGTLLEAGDFDGDGMDELIATPTWGPAVAYDVDKQKTKWSLDVFNVGATHLMDVDGDGTLEFLVGEGQSSDILGIDPATLATEFLLENPSHGTTEITAGDCDGDGDPEVIWGAGHSSTGPDFAFVADWQTAQFEWRSVHLDGPFRAPARGDLDGDGSDELVSVTDRSEAGYDSGRLLVFDLDLNLLAISQGMANGNGWSGTYQVSLRNVDSDPAEEIVVATSRHSDGTMEIYEWDGALAFTRTWEVPDPKPTGAFVAADALDLDGDGQLEVVGIAGQHAFSYGHASKLLEWQSLPVVGGVAGMAVADTDEDLSLELVVLGADGDLRVFDGQSGALEATLIGDYSCIEVARTLVSPDLLRLGTVDGRLLTLQYQGTGYQQLSDIALVDGEVEGLTFGNAGTLWVGSEGTLSLHLPHYASTFWESCSEYGAPFGVGVVYGTDYVLTAGDNGLVAFKRHPGD